MDKKKIIRDIALTVVINLIIISIIMFMIFNRTDSKLIDFILFFGAIVATAIISIELENLLENKNIYIIINMTIPLGKIYENIKNKEYKEVSELKLYTKSNMNVLTVLGTLSLIVFFILVIDYIISGGIENQLCKILGYIVYTLYIIVLLLSNSFKVIGKHRSLTEKKGD